MTNRENNERDIWYAVNTVTKVLGEAHVAYTLIDTVALFVQGIAVPEVGSIDVSIQWDQLETAHQAFAVYQPDIVKRDYRQASFTFSLNDILVCIKCYYNTVVAADPTRVCIQLESGVLWAKSLDFCLRELPMDHQLAQATRQHWAFLQEQNTRLNGMSWNHASYDAWMERFGSPQEAAARLTRDPEGRLFPLDRYMGRLDGRKVINLLGSHGGKAIAMALLGADATVIDISADNARYANEVAQAAHVNIRYLVADVLNLPETELTHDYDLVLMENGILHYFVDLAPLFAVVGQLLRPGGRLILQDFHPVSTKLIQSKGKKHKVTGNYFDQTIHSTEVAFSKYLTEEHRQGGSQVYLRKWTLGETVTAAASAGLLVRELVEEPNTKLDDMGIPKTFTLVADML